MIYIIITSTCQFGLEFIDEIETTLDISNFNLKLGDILQKNKYYPERIIRNIEVQNI